ncbi:MAG TPA: DUF1993 domain-containing protein [Woeseiaceae bacterium]|nr:DUF1993 domain-containing protein [Woeseiaceae bacterium]
MALTVYDVAIAPLSRMLANLDRIVTLAETWAEERSIDPAALIQARLYPDMLPFVSQVRIATDTAKGAAARLAGTELPRWADDEVTFADIHARIRKAIDYLATFRPEQFEGAEQARIEMKLPKRTLDFSGRDYITGYVLPNFHFHVTTAYAILRHNGVPIGKQDYLGDTR